MSKEAEYRAQAARLRALAETSHDFSCRHTLQDTADCWRILADVEAKGERPTRWGPLMDAERRDAEDAVACVGATGPVRP